MSKAFVCTCEDVTADEVAAAIARGYGDLESLKRYTGLGTGLCQGKQCQAAAARLLSERRPASAPPLRPFVARPPLVPTELSLFASVPVDEGCPAGAGVPLPPPEHRVAPATAECDSEPLPERASVLIIGGGIMGLALAYNLALQGARDVVVVERGYLCAGASGRNGGGVRAQWGTPTLVELARRSIALMARFAHDMGVNVWFRRGGYLFLAKSDAVVARLERSARLHERLGVPTRLVTPSEACELVPELDAQGVRLAAWNPDDAVVFPWPFLWGYAERARALGVRVVAHTAVTGFELSAGRVVRVRTSRGAVACDRVVLAAGAWSPEVAALAGVSLPNRPVRHEICASEPVAMFLGPLLSVLDEGMYVSQSMRGELVGGMGDRLEPPGLRLGSSLRFLARYARSLTRHLPRTGGLKILRQWSGPYDVTPDHSPILGSSPGVANLLQLSGFVGHGFMMAPAVTERMAAWMASGASDELFERFSLRRFAEGRLEREDMVIG